MKNLFYLAFLLFLLSCNSDDTEFSNPEFVDAVTGRYVLEEAYTEVALDLTMDGVAHTDLFQWDNYCNGSHIFESFYLTMVKRNYTRIHFHLPRSGNDMNGNQSHCIRDGSSFYEIIIDEHLEAVYIDNSGIGFSLENERHDERLYDQFRAKMVDFSWEDGVGHVILDIEFYRADGVWEEARAHLKYHKYSNRV